MKLSKNIFFFFFFIQTKYYENLSLKEMVNYKEEKKQKYVIPFLTLAMCLRDYKELKWNGINRVEKIGNKYK